jgi:hypothetical protein
MLGPAGVYSLSAALGELLLGEFPRSGFAAEAAELFLVHRSFD